MQLIQYFFPEFIPLLQVMTIVFDRLAAVYLYEYISHCVLNFCWGERLQHGIPGQCLNEGFPQSIHVAYGYAREEDIVQGMSWTLQMQGHARAIKPVSYTHLTLPTTPYV